jgi:hypothetical protein
MDTKYSYKWIIHFEMKQNTYSMALKKGFNTIMDNKQSVGSPMEEDN